MAESGWFEFCAGISLTRRRRPGARLATLVVISGSLVASGLAGGCSSSSDGGAPPSKDAGADQADGEPPDAPSDASPPDAASDADAAADADADAAVSPLEISKSTTTFTEAEQQVAVAPDGTIAVAWMGYSYNDPLVVIGYRFSTDGGQSFTTTSYFTLPNGLSAVDPAVSVDANGNFYASMVGAHYPPADGDPSHVYVAKAASGSLSFGTPVEVTDPNVVAFYDHPKIMTTQSGTVVVAYFQSDTISSLTNLGIAARSSDGVNWQRSTIIESGTDQIFSNLFWVCEGDGILYSTYLEYDGATALYGVAVRTSIDGASSWSTTSTFASLAGEIPAGLDPSCVASGDDVWVSYGTSSGSAGDQTMLDAANTLPVAHSSDRGQTFATRVEAFDTAQGYLAVHPVLVRETGGALDLAYLSGQQDQDPNATLRFARAPASDFGPSVTVDGPLELQLKRTGYDWLGDYIGAVEHGGTLFFAYPKNVGGYSHVYFATSAPQ